MSFTDRQNRLLQAEDWKKVYQSYRNADFKSYDFDSLRRTMIRYLRENYPEDFNDYIESSEYLALIDMIAFLGQNISFRIDLNARENFLELAERRESVLRMARLLSYNPKRNLAANGLLKMVSVTTSENVLDSNNTNLAEQTILWSDPSNSNWKEQFQKVLNAALPQNGIIGKPIKSSTVDGVLTQQYRIDATNLDIPVYSFSKPVNGVTTQFEIVSTDIGDNQIIEEPPLPGNNLAFVYREDGQGNGSANTGYFCHFRQGQTSNNEFAIDNPISNQTIAIDATNVNDTDVYLYQLDSIGSESRLWTKIPSIEGNNVAYNDIFLDNRFLYAVQSRIDDRINLQFSDGIFGELPKGRFRIYYRTSANKQFIIRPADLTNINIEISYLSKQGTTETLTIGFELTSVVENSATTESNERIKRVAPQTYYTQNRMVTGEDYQIGPLNTSQQIIKAKSVNRTSSGISRYFDLIDATGKYSNTNIFATDGVIYREDFETKNSFTFASRTDIEGAVENTIYPLINARSTKNFYQSKYAKIIATDLQAEWQQYSSATNISTGILANIGNIPYQVGSFAGGALRYIEPGCLLKFTAPAGYYFKEGELLEGAGTEAGASEYIWTKVISVIGSGTAQQADGSGSITFNNIVPQGAILNEVRPKFNTRFTSDVYTQIIDQIFAYKTFGVRYDQGTRQWKVIINENLDSINQFSNGKAGDNTNNQLDSSWLLLFKTNGEKYDITTRGLRYIFESDKEVNFYYDSTDKIYDQKTGKLVKDVVKVLNVNTKPDSTSPFLNDIDWEIVNDFKNTSGYVNTKKIEVSFFDADDDGTLDDPDIFDAVVAPGTDTDSKYIYFKKQNINETDVFDYYNGADIRTVGTESEIGGFSQYTNNTVFYIVDVELFKILIDSKLVITNDYKAFVGRDKLRFQYIHSASSDKRIDPSASNIIDTYLLTREYDNNFRKYLRGETSRIPLPPSSDQLFINFGAEINRTKSLTDEVIYHPVKYKVLFGSQAEADLQAVFKIVKNSEGVVNDNDVKARVISAINQYFRLENWDFGDTFNFTELATYVMNQVSPDITTFLIVPKQGDKSFGSLFQINAQPDEIFISGATVDDIEVIDSITSSRIQASGQVVTSANINNTGITSAVLGTSTPTTASTTTGTTTTTTSSSSSSGSSGSSGSGGSGGSGGGYSY